MRHNPSTDDFSRRAQEKNKNKKEEALYFDAFRQALPYGRLAQISGYVFVSWNVINCAKFYRNQLRGLDSVRGRSLTIPIGLRYRR